MNSSTYIYILKDTLRKKIEVLDKIIIVVEDQAKILASQPIDLDIFDSTILEKEPLIVKLDELDDGFDKIYARVSEELHNNRQEFQQDIIELQEMIRNITEKSVKIQSIERNNRNSFQLETVERKQEVKRFKTSNQVVSNYYKNMGTQYQGESYFLDKKK